MVKPLETTVRLLSTLPSLSSVVGVSRSVHGLGGVLFLDFASGERVVVKALGNEIVAGSTLFSREVCRKAGIAHPDIAILDTTEGAGAECAAHVRQLLSTEQFGEGKSAKELEMLAKGAENVFKQRHVLLMEYVQGGVDALPAGDAETCRRRLEEHADGVGQLMAVDMLLNNWDRVGNTQLSGWMADPEGAWAPKDGPGNLDNLMLGEVADRPGEPAALVAIDTDLKVGYANGGSTDAEFVAEVGALLEELRESEQRGRTSRIVQEAQRCFERKRGVVGLSNGALIAMQAGLVGMLTKLAHVGDGDGEATVKEALRAAFVAVPAQDGISLLAPGGTAEALIARTAAVLELWRRGEA